MYLDYTFCNHWFSAWLCQSLGVVGKRHASVLHLLCALYMHRYLGMLAESHTDYVALKTTAICHLVCRTPYIRTTMLVCSTIFIVVTFHNQFTNTRRIVKLDNRKRKNSSHYINCFSQKEGPKLQGMDHFSTYTTKREIRINL